MKNWEWVRENVRFGKNNTAFADAVFNLFCEYEKVMNRKSGKIYEAEKNGIEVLKEMIEELEKRA